MTIKSILVGDKDYCRNAAGMIGCITLLWFIIGVASWPAMEPPVLYKVPLCIGFGLWFWFTSGWLGGWK